MIKISAVLTVMLIGVSIRNRKIFNFVCLINGYKLTEEEKENTPKELLPFIRIYSNLFFVLGFLLLAEIFTIRYFSVYQHVYNTLITFAIWVIIVVIVCYRNRYEVKQYINFWLKRK